MLGFTSHRKFVSRLLVLFYLLIGSGMGNVLLWCQESEAFTHLEYNLSGSCQNTCEIGLDSNKAAEATIPAAGVENDSAHCLDSPISLAHASTEKIKTSLDSDSLAWSIIPAPPIDIFSVAYLGKLNLNAQPPPSLALAHLRTVVLLN